MTGYRTIVADPPWPMPESGRWTGSGGNWAAYNGATTRLPYLELFARRARFGWDYAGDGSLGTVDVPGLRAPGVAA